MKINNLGITAKAFLFVLAVFIVNACENANEATPHERFEARLLLNKKHVKDYVSTISDLTFSRQSDYESSEGFFADAKSRLSLIDPQANAEFIAKVQQHYEANKTKEADLQIFEETLVLTLQKGIENISINRFSNARGENDYITEEEIMIYFDEFKETMRREFELAESSIIQEDTLSDDEKIGLSVAIVAAMETADVIVDDLVEEMIINETDESGRVEFRRLGNLFKKTVNLITTVVSRMVRPTLQGALFGTLLIPLGQVWGPVAGASVGALLGLVEGLDCYRLGFCAVCVFCHDGDNRNETCHSDTDPRCNT